MKFIFFLLFLIPLQGSSQDLVSIVAKTNAGTIVLSENYIHFEHIGVQRIEIVNESDCCFDLYAWKWILRETEYRFMRYYEKILLVRCKKGTETITGYWKVYKYELNFTKE